MCIITFDKEKHYILREICFFALRKLQNIKIVAKILYYQLIN